ncbi:site-2 protease family protein [Helicobacter cetorum]|uniref:Membrane protein n=1 Tax=Helicobacter cetorum (strain ATCC BAA-540 / CCUG 52418 / MIT 99-5656) TaxID=1163745 RepID=I0EQU0_HELCM|nr:site-2 protease family protein [Helicobacter cetorum]AFI05309.1 membrane protein [Helicobacter cetorum MIT 99-5656]
MQFFDVSLEGFVAASMKILALLVAIIGHEIMHGYSAFLFGDRSAKDTHRLSLNPIRHLDMMGSVLLPAILLIFQAPFLFGWAKPVPIDMRYIVSQKGSLACVIVSLAGVFYNFSLALILALITHFSFHHFEINALDFNHLNLYQLALMTFLIQGILYNLVLGIFNSLPIPPLDGSKALGFLALYFKSTLLLEWFSKMERYGLLIVFVFLFIPPLSEFFIHAPTRFLFSLLLS